MDADFEIELGADDDVLELPWRSEDGRLRYYDLKSQPDLLLYVQEAASYPELGEFLGTLNGRSIFLTAKCDVWTESELSEAEKIYGEPLKFGCYVDVLFEAPKLREDLAAYEALVRRLCKLLGEAPEISAAAEFDVRRCYSKDGEDLHNGYYVTCYTFGYGSSEQDARRRWGIALKLIQNALLQVSGEIRCRSGSSQLQ